MRKDFSAAVKRELINISKGYCMICGKSTNKPKIAHIIPASENGPRSEYRHMYDEKFIISSSNGLSLCGPCHDEIDEPGLNVYSLEELFEFNKNTKLNYRLREEYRENLGLTNVQYTTEISNYYAKLLELLDIEDEDLESLISSDSTFTKIKVDNKLKKNKFTLRQKRKVKECYAYEFYIFKEAIENNVIISAKFQAAIKILYDRLSKIYKSQNEIFDKMMELMEDPSKGKVENNIILSYFFIICEVFLK